jgi:hypothetical protein
MPSSAPANYTGPLLHQHQHQGIYITKCSASCTSVTCHVPTAHGTMFEASRRNCSSPPKCLATCLNRCCTPSPICSARPASFSPRGPRARPLGVKPDTHLIFSPFNSGLQAQWPAHHIRQPGPILRASHEKPSGAMRRPVTLWPSVFCFPAFKNI